MYNVGQRIYYTGDMANRSGWGIITHARPCNWYGVNYTLDMQDGRVFSISPNTITDTFNGHSTYRFVTKEAYDEYRNQALAQYA